MESFYKWFASSPIASFLRHLSGIVLTLAVAEFAKIGAFDFTNWRAWVIAGLVAALPPLVKWIMPSPEV